MSARQVVIATLVILGVLIGAYLLWLALDVLLLLFLGILVASAIEPVVERLRRGPLSRGQGVLIVYTLIVGTAALIAVVTIPPLVQQVSGLADDLPRRLDDLRVQVGQWNPRPLRDAATRIVLWAQSTLIGGSIPSSIPTAATTTGNETAQVTSTVVDVGLTAVNIVVAVVTVFVIAYYWMVERASLKRTVLRLAGPRHARRINTLWVAIEARLGAWVRGQLILMLSVGGSLGVGYYLLGLPGAFALALWAAVAELIPMLGPYIGVAPALVVALTISPTTALILLVYAVVVQSVEGYVLVPRVMGHAVGVSPLVVFLGILVGITLDGLPGGFIAVPIAGALQVILQDLLSPTADVTEHGEDAIHEVGDASLAHKPVPPHAHPVLPGSHIAADASGTGIPAPAAGSPSTRR